MVFTLPAISFRRLLPLVLFISRMYMKGFPRNRVLPSPHEGFFQKSRFTF
ncbi:unnamed protein product, partial [Pylaiella littoralis]